MKHKIEITEDGSSTIFVKDLNEHYHSTKGAITESQHIYINSGLKQITKKNISVLEIGFGTGLNALLTLDFSKQTDKKINYCTLELYPLDLKIIKELSYCREDLLMLHKLPWETKNLVCPNFIFTKLNCNFVNFKTKESYDVIYFDAFAPEKQPEMWDQNLFNYLYKILNIGGNLTTYCAKGVIRRMLQESGFKVERLQGPPNGKREILRATKI